MLLPFSILTTAHRQALTPTSNRALVHRHAAVYCRHAAVVLQQQDTSPLDSILTSAKKLSEALSEGRGWKQGVAEAMAGEYDPETIVQPLSEIVVSAPVVIFQVRCCPPTLDVVGSCSAQARHRCPHGTTGTAPRVVLSHCVEQQLLQVSILVNADGCPPCLLCQWPTSPSCQKAVKLLRLAGVEPKTVDLEFDAIGNARRAELGRMTGRSSVPSIWIGGQYVGGCDDGPTEAAPGLVEMSFAGTSASSERCLLCVRTAPRRWPP